MIKKRSPEAGGARAAPSPRRRAGRGPGGEAVPPSPAKQKGAAAAAAELPGRTEGIDSAARHLPVGLRGPKPGACGRAGSAPSLGGRKMCRAGVRRGEEATGFIGDPCTGRWLHPTAASSGRRSVWAGTPASGIPLGGPCRDPAGDTSLSPAQVSRAPSPAAAMSRRSQRLVTSRYYPGDDDATTSSSSTSLLGGTQLPFKETTGRSVGGTMAGFPLPKSDRGGAFHPTPGTGHLPGWGVGRVCRRERDGEPEAFRHGRLGCALLQAEPRAPCPGSAASPGACRGGRVPAPSSPLQRDGDREEEGGREVRCKCRPENRSGASGSDARDGREASARQRLQLPKAAAIRCGGK